ncbi:MAG: purine-nucleoside phosphorylase [Lachnospiraceae bacterium]|nr:purine-nucleoside phosphorylase [Lachnospiraceae bacterium]
MTDAKYAGNAVYGKLMGCYESCKGRVPFKPKVGIVLGSGLGDLADSLDVEGVIDYHDIEGFPVSTAPGHKGRYVFARIPRRGGAAAAADGAPAGADAVGAGEAAAGNGGVGDASFVGGGADAIGAGGPAAGHGGAGDASFVGGGADADSVPVVLMQGRIHHYEGYPMSDVVLPIRLMGLMGIEALLLTNASGSVNTAFAPGDLMMITDQISVLVPSPLVGQNLDALGTRFPDMSEIYRKELRSAILKAALKEGIEMRQGVYMQFSGPNFESPAEVRMAGILGADAVGMSTACEALAANHMGIKVAGISCIANLGCGLSDKPLSGDDVNEIAARTGPKFQRLVTRAVGEFPV